MAVDPKIARIRRKADAYVTAWHRRYKTVPIWHAVVLGLCPPSAETKIGDAWLGPDGVLGTADDTRNWGATTLRTLNASELAAVKAAGVTPSVGAGHALKAKAAQAAIVAAGLPIPSGTRRGMFVPRAEIHCDSRTELLASGAKITVPYFTWFAAFDTDADGAEYYLTFVADVGNPARAVLENPKSTVYHLAAAMYLRGYFFGFYPHTNYTTAGADQVMGTTDDIAHDGNQENIQAYALWLAPHFTTISAALKGWVPGGLVNGTTEPSPPPPMTLVSESDIWHALELLGCVRPMGRQRSERRYYASLGFYQGGNIELDGDLLAVDGDVGKETKAALARDLRALGYEVA